MLHVPYAAAPETRLGGICNFFVAVLDEASRDDCWKHYSIQHNER